MIIMLKNGNYYCTKQLGTIIFNSFRFFGFILILIFS